MIHTRYMIDGNSRTGEAPVIRTPDQRLHVFVSSTLDELAPERAAAREAIAQLRLTPVLFESGARPYPPRELYQSYLAQSDIFLGLYWQRYGWVAPGMEVSGLEDEYQLSADKPRLIYVKTPAPEREPGLQRLLDRIRADGAASYQHFATPQELRERIANDLALLLTEHFEQANTPADAIHHAPLPVARGHLIDREREVALVRELLLREDVGLVTLTGPGGVGKTRVAVQVASELASRFADGAAFVSLAQLRDPEPVVQTVARALQVSEAPGQSIGERLLAYLRERQLLLVLDNVEQLVSAAPLATQALEGAPRLTLLVTSREPLRLGTEHVVPIQPLALPDPRHLPGLDRLSQVPSVALFLERARAVNPDFALNTDNAAAIVEICRRLDGLPLALELAAARLSLLTPQALLARMKERLPLLTRGARDLPQRQQTLRNTLAWSYDLLDEREQHLFQQLAVFAGSFPLEAVEAVCADEGSSTSSSSEEGDNSVMELVAQLRDKSLVQPSNAVDGEPYFRMLDTIREYALEQLVASGEEEAVKQRHADYYLRLAETAEPHVRRPERDVWLDRLDRAHDNLRAVLAWSSSEHGAAQIGLRLAGALSWYWYMRGYLREGGIFLEEFLAQSEPADGSAVRGKALYGASLLAWAEGDSGVSGERAEQSVALFRALGDVYWLANALAMLGIIQLSQGKLEAARSSLEESRSLFEEQNLPLFLAFVVYQLGRAAFAGQDVLRAKTHFQQSLALFQEEGDRLGEAMALTALGIVAAAQGDAAAAQSLLTQSVPLMRAAGDRRDLTQSLLTAGTVRLKQGDLQQAHNLFTESLRLWEGFADHEQAAVIRRALTGLAEVAAAQGRAERAGVLFGAAETLSPLPGNFLSETFKSDPGLDMAQARAHLDQASFEAGWAAGQAMTQEQALSYALLD
jgi:predicted ATPase/tetratricopeptide (TPR) repeat protein